jgi:hypothetical protein
MMTLLNKYLIGEMLTFMMAGMGFGFSFAGWFAAKQDDRENLRKGVNGVTGTGTRWLVGREWDRLVLQGIVLLTTAMVIAWRIEHPIAADVALVYATRGLSTFLITLGLLRSTFRDRMVRKQITEIIREETVRERRKTNVTAAMAQDVKDTKVIADKTLVEAKEISQRLDEHGPAAK